MVITFVDVFKITRTLSCCVLFFFLMIRRPPRSTLDRSSAASDVYKRQGESIKRVVDRLAELDLIFARANYALAIRGVEPTLSLIHISEPTRPY